MGVGEIVARAPRCPRSGQEQCSCSCRVCRVSTRHRSHTNPAPAPTLKRRGVFIPTFSFVSARPSAVCTRYVALTHTHTHWMDLGTNELCSRLAADHTHHHHLLALSQPTGLALVPTVRPHELTFCVSTSRRITTGDHPAVTPNSAASFVSARPSAVCTRACLSHPTRPGDGQGGWRRSTPASARRPPPSRCSARCTHTLRSRSSPLLLGPGLRPFSPQPFD